MAAFFLGHTVLIVHTQERKVILLGHEIFTHTTRAVRELAALISDGQMLNSSANHKHVVEIKGANAKVGYVPACLNSGNFPNGRRKVFMQR